MTIDELLVIAQAAKDGRIIQETDLGKWRDIDLASLLRKVNFRVKPEPREWTLELRGGNIYWPLPLCPEGERELVKVREVLK